MSRSAKGRVICALAALIWGIAFVVMKDALDNIGVFWLLAVRFLLGGVIVSAVFHRRLGRLRGKTLLHSVQVGAVLAAAYIVQTFGLRETTPGKNAFLTAVYCVIVPFIDWRWSRKAPGAKALLAGFICLGGIGLISLEEGLTVGAGDLLSLLCGVLFAFQVTMLGHYGREDDPIALTVGQLLTVGVICLAGALLTEPLPGRIPASAWWEIGYLVVFSTALALVMQNVGQSMTSPASAGILLSLESVFGALSSVLFYGEQLSARVAVGFAVVFAAVVLSCLPEKTGRS